MRHYGLVIINRNFSAVLTKFFQYIHDTGDEILYKKIYAIFEKSNIKIMHTTKLTVSAHGKIIWGWKFRVILTQ